MSDMSSKLPYRLTEGVTATDDGIIFYTSAAIAMAVCSASEGNNLLNVAMPTVWRWPSAAERLRYREGQPWCTSSDGAFTRDIVCHSGKRKPSGLSGYIFGEPIKDNPLHRLSSILCDGADEFRVLHWCIHNLPND